MKVQVSEKYLKGHFRKTKDLRNLLASKPHTKRIKKYLDMRHHILERHIAGKDHVLDFEELG